MDLAAFMKKYADEIDGQYSGYDSTHVIIIVPLSGGRYQSVVGTITDNSLYNRKVIAFTSKVCAYDGNLPLKDLLEETSHFYYSRFVIRDNFLQLEAVGNLDGTSEDSMKNMIQEVANLADQYEMNLTGVDVH